MIVTYSHWLSTLNIPRLDTADMNDLMMPCRVIRTNLLPRSWAGNPYRCFLISSTWVLE